MLIYLFEVFEQEIEMGFIRGMNTDLKTAVFFRDISNIEIDDSNSNNVETFIELETDQINLLDDLKERIEMKLSDENKHNISVSQFYHGYFIISKSVLKSLI